MRLRKEMYFYKLVILTKAIIRYTSNVFTLKTNTLKYFFIGSWLLFLAACSTKKNTFLSRNSHALSTKYNILYNGQLALDKGLMDLRNQYQDNFWEVLPIERMQITEEKLLPGENKNADFERAETKAIKAIQKHSMNIQGSEKNPQMDEAHLLLGKSRYYDQRFVPALEAFNYVLYKYPSSNKIYEVKIWREKTNMRLDNDALAVNNLRKLLKEIKFKDQIFADANATLAQAFLNLEEKDSAVAKLKLARDFTKLQEEKARYLFILGQLYDQMNQPDSARASFQAVIDMKRKAARQYVIHSHMKLAKNFSPSSGDTIAFIKKFNDLIEDRENRPYLDVLYHHLGWYYDKQKNTLQAKKNYNLSLKKKGLDTYLQASNYRNLATIHFDRALYQTAGKYYDSTLVHLKPRTREFNAIKKKRENLEDVIKYERIAQKNDSIISLSRMTSTEKTAYFNEYIEKLKAAAEKLALEAEKAENKKRNEEGGGLELGSEDAKRAAKAQANMGGAANKNVFYFYNPVTVAYGQKEFKKIWGKKALKDNWRLSKDNSLNTDSKENTDEKEPDTDKATAEKDLYNPEFYINQLPQSQTVIDSLSKERNFAYYQLGVIYKEKFKEYPLAVDKLEKLLASQPEERLVLPAMYNLFKLYEGTDPSKAALMKARIINEFPNSRYAQILLNPSEALATNADSPVSVYDKLYEEFEQNGDFKSVLVQTNQAIDRFTGDEIVPKLELLKAHLTGKLNGLSTYKEALNYVALTYPNVEEGKAAEKMLAVNIPKLEALQLGKYPSVSWKILYPSQNFDDQSTKYLLQKINKFISERGIDKLSVSQDVYTMTDNFVVVHGLKSEEYAKGIASILKEFKEYSVPNTPIIISTENYTIVQIKKNLSNYLKGELVENPQQPNWDGTIEKQELPVEQPKQEERVAKNAQQERQGNGKLKSNLKNTEDATPVSTTINNDNPNQMGLPPTPQLPTSTPNRKK